MVNCVVVQERGLLPMITISYEVLLIIIALCGGAGYILGKDVSKARK